MTKKAQRHPLRYDKEQAGCIWGFISFFDFRHGRLSRRLLSDRSRFTRQVVGVGCSKPDHHIARSSNENHHEIYDDEERVTMITDTSRTSVKELMEEEMVIVDDCKDPVMNGDIKTKEPEPEQKGRSKKKRRRRRKASKSLRDTQSEVDASQNLGEENPSLRDSEDKTSQKLDLEIVANDICQQIYLHSTANNMDDSNNEIDLQIEQKTPVVDKKLSDAIRLFVDRRSRNGKIDESKEFMDALETLSSNKELILELLKDPNSILVKHIENLEGSLLGMDRKRNSFDNSKLLDGDLNMSKKRHKFFRRRCKSEEKIKLSGDESCQATSRIVILKPGLPFGSSDGLENGMRNERSGSQFSFTEIKRRLKNAMGKEKNGIPANDNAYKTAYERQFSGNSEKGGWNSPNRNHFYIEKFARPANGMRNKDTSLKPKSTESTVENESLENNERRISNIYIEAKRHLSEMLSQGDEFGDLSNRPSPKALGKMISLPGFNLSPINSPRESDYRFVTAKHRLSSHNSFHAVNENISNLTTENDLDLCDKNSDIKDELNHANEEGGTLSPKRSEKDAEDDVESIQTTDVISEVIILPKTEASHQGENIILDASDVQCISSAIEDEEAAESVGTCDEELTVDSLEQEQLLSSPLTSPPSSSIAKHIGDVDMANEKVERPSPVSVLEPLYTDDDISPASIKFPPVEPPMKPIRIQFEELSSTRDQELFASAYLDDEESAFEYVEAVLLASDLNINEYRHRWLSSDPILDPSLFNEVELFSSRSSQDQRLLFDCTNEVLDEACGGYFGYFPCVSFVKHNIRPIPRGMEFINEIWNGVEWHFLAESSPRGMEQIIKKDMKKDKKWMDLRFDVQGIGYEIGDSIFEELVEDILLSFTNKDPIIDSSSLPEPEEWIEIE